VEPIRIFIFYLPRFVSSHYAKGSVTDHMCCADFWSWGVTDQINCAEFLVQRKEHAIKFPRSPPFTVTGSQKVPQCLSSASPPPLSNQIIKNRIDHQTNIIELTTINDERLCANRGWRRESCVNQATKTWDARRYGRAREVSVSNAQYPLCADSL
jgi:hypothetical protein